MVRSINNQFNRLEKQETVVQGSVSVLAYQVSPPLMSSREMPGAS